MAETKFECSTPNEEIQQRQKRLQYRYDWLKALILENQRELNDLQIVKAQDDEQEDEDEILPSDTELLAFVNQLPYMLVDSNQTFSTPQDIQHRRSELETQNHALQALFNQTQREIELMGEILASANQPSECEGG